MVKKIYKYKEVGYVNLKYKPGPKDVVVQYRIDPIKKFSLRAAAVNTASESSIGTWTEVTTYKERLKNLRPTVFNLNNRTKEVKIAYPEDLFEPGNMPGILSSIAGNVFGMKSLQHLRLEDVTFTKKIVKAFPGPKFGISGLQKITKIKKRPLLGTIVKPKVGLNAKEHAKVAYEAWVGGCDFVKDDENLVSMRFNKVEDRFRETLKLKRKAERETGEVKLYAANITAPTMEAIRRAKLVNKFKGNYHMVDIITMGFSGVQAIRNQNLGLPLHGHRAMHAAFTRLPYHGTSMLFLAKAARLCGIDSLHIGTAGVGKMEGGLEKIQAIERAIERKKVKEITEHHVLQQNWYGLKPSLAVASGGVWPGGVPALVRRMGKDILINMGGGIHGHKGGTRKGATAARQAIEATMKGIPLKTYAKTHKELEQAVKQWGVFK
jgi:ribulose-bisphosphate carboxylase large chain